MVTSASHVSLPFVLSPAAIDFRLLLSGSQLNRATPLLSYSAARDGKIIYEKQPREFINFQCKAWKIYADTAKCRQAQREAIKLSLQKWGL